ncbi:tetratricopeptide repeat protein [Methylobacillus methanolivorans]|uniref:Tetratricopeptide repeat protein n=1 Tax=Methylobacillus methanolivorans TaxID=1848927 RepID=A0ABW8GLC4_9PROT
MSVQKPKVIPPLVLSDIAQIASTLFSSEDTTANLDPNLSPIKQLSIFNMKAEMGIAKFQVIIGNAYYDGIHIEQNIELAEYWWEEAAEQGNTEAELNLMQLYIRMNESPARVIPYLKKLVTKGNPEAMFHYGLALTYGKGVKKNVRTGESWLSKAARLNHIDALVALSKIYSEIKQLRNHTKSHQYQKRACDLGHKKSMYEYSYNKILNEKNITDISSKVYLEKLAADGHPEPLMLLAHLKVHSGNFVESVKHLHDAAMLNYGPANWMLGRCYEDGWTVKRSPSKAHYYKNRSKILGFDGGFGKNPFTPNTLSTTVIGGGYA